MHMIRLKGSVGHRSAETTKTMTIHIYRTNAIQILHTPKYIPQCLASKSSVAVIGFTVLEPPLPPDFYIYLKDGAHGDISQSIPDLKAVSIGSSIKSDSKGRMRERLRELCQLASNAPTVPERLHHEHQETFGEHILSTSKVRCFCKLTQIPFIWEFINNNSFRYNAFSHWNLSWNCKNFNSLVFWLNNLSFELFRVTGII